MGLRCARQCALRGLLLRWLLLLCHSRHGRRPGPQKDNNTAAQQKSCFFGVGLRCARQCALRGLLLRWLLLLLGYSNTGPFAGLLEQRTFCRATRTEDLCRATRTEDLCRATRTEDLCRAARTEDLCRAASASPPSASAFTSPLPPARC